MKRFDRLRSNPLRSGRGTSRLRLLWPRFPFRLARRPVTRKNPNAATGGTATGGVSGAMATGGATTGGATATGGTATGGTSGGAQLEYRPCALDARVGAFTIELGDGYTAVAGAVRDAVTPTDMPEVVMRRRRVQAYRKRNLFCNPPCASGTTCSDAMSCVPPRRTRASER